MSDLKDFAEKTFKAAQSPVVWLLSAERLRDGAEAILDHEKQFELPYLQAYDVAAKEALAIACSEGNDSGAVEIKSRVPNYPAAQLLYAYAIENLLKGIMVAKDSSLVSGGKLNAKLRSHDIAALANAAFMPIHVQEIDIAKALSKLSVWAGRYPVALFQNEYVTTPNADELLDYGSRHPYVRQLYDRFHGELSNLLPKPVLSRWACVVVQRPLGI